MTQNNTLTRPIIFLGAPRSGTSVISEIVMRHHQIGFPSQYQNRFKKSTSINWLRRIFDNNIWRFHGQKKQLNKVPVFNRLLFRPVEGYAMWNALLDGEIDFGKGFLVNTPISKDKIVFLRRYFSEILKKQGKERLAFKITGPSRIQFLQSIFPDAQFIYITRRPVPTVSSLLNVDFWTSSGIKKIWWTGCYSSDELKIAEQISDDPIALTSLQLKKLQEVTASEIEQFEPDITTIPYEYFVSNPHDAINEILEFVGLKTDNACLDYLEKNTIFNQNKEDEEYFDSSDLEKIKTYLA